MPDRDATSRDAPASPVGTPPVSDEFVQVVAPATIHRYENGDCSYLALAFRDMYGWVPLNMGGEHVVAADPDGVHAWDIRGRSLLDDLAFRWGEVEPWDPWAKQAFGLSTDAAGEEHRDVARLVVAALSASSTDAETRP